jgi:hypothetical protein
MSELENKGAKNEPWRWLRDEQAARAMKEIRTAFAGVDTSMRKASTPQKIAH